MIVPISEGEVFQIWRWARERLAAKDPSAKSRRFGNKSDFTLHFEGVKGEYAVTKLFLMPFDNNPLPFGDKHEPDLVLPNGMTAQVKFREKPEWDFALGSTKPEEFKADIGILVANASPNAMNDDVVVVGWISREEFLEVAGIANYTGKKGAERLHVTPQQMRDIRELLWMMHEEAA